MEREFIPYNLALELKELGFDESCFGFYNIKGNFIKDFDITRDIIENLEIKSIELHQKICLAPTFSQAFRWFREKYDLQGITFKNKKNKVYNEDIKTHSYTIIGNYNNVLYNILSNEYKLSFEETELKCLKKLIELCKNN